MNLNTKPENTRKRLRKNVHIGFSLVLVVVIVIFDFVFKDVSVIWELFKAAGYTYGPLLGLFAFGLFTKAQIKDKWVWLVALASPVLAYLLNLYSADLFGGYKIGFEILIINGILMFLGLLLIRETNTVQ